METLAGEANLLSLSAWLLLICCYPLSTLCLGRLDTKQHCTGPVEPCWLFTTQLPDLQYDLLEAFVCNQHLKYHFTFWRFSCLKHVSRSDATVSMNGYIFWVYSVYLWGLFALVFSKLLLLFWTLKLVNRRILNILWLHKTLIICPIKKIWKAVFCF